MSKILKYEQLFIFSEVQQKCFHCSFGDSVNIIHGANTSGKSTIIQTILYMFGINDVKKYIDPIFTPDFILRLDVTITENDIKTPITIIRNDGSIFIKKGNEPLLSFNGISGDTSFEHRRLKAWLRELLGFNLMLLQGDEYKEASIETMFLPYYISQSVGWVSIRKTFEGLDFYKNFKENFLDYYLSINNNDDLLEKIKLEEERKSLKSKKEVLESTIQEDVEVMVAGLESDTHKVKCTQYITSFKDQETKLKELNSNFLNLCNELEFLKVRQRTLKNIKPNLLKQNPISAGCCPVCRQTLPLTIETAYIHLQDVDDTESELLNIKTKIKAIVTKIDSCEKKRAELSDQIEKERNILNQYSANEVTMERWINSQANEMYVSNIESKKIEILKRLDEITTKLDTFKTETEINSLRNTEKREFRGKFENYMSSLQVEYSIFYGEDRFFDLYKISALPYQGVELLKAMMAYHFAFNQQIKSNNSIHRLPFMLDAIFKEDIDLPNKNLILAFIRDCHPKDTQLIFSMADKIEGDNQIRATTVNDEYYNGLAHLIHISDDKRSILKDWNEEYDELKLETISVMDS